MHVKNNDKKPESFSLTEETQECFPRQTHKSHFCFGKNSFSGKNNILCSFKGNCCGPAQQFANTVVKQDAFLLGKEIN